MSKNSESSNRFLAGVARPYSTVFTTIGRKCPYLAIPALLVAMVLTMAGPAQAQEIFEWKVIPIQVKEEVPHKETVMIEETEFETQKTTVYRPQWTTQTRQRRVVTKKPVQETRERIVKKTYLRPKTVTKYRDREIKETSYRTVTRYRNETYSVQKPVIETEYREEKRTVRKPVTETMTEVRKTTSYKPVTETKTELVAEPGGIGLVVQPNLVQRPRLRYLTPGYYTDPLTGLTVYRRRGLHWSTPNVVTGVAQLPATLTPQQRTETRFIPETTEERRPIDVTRVVESTETFKVPVSVERMVETTQTRRVPYSVTEPVETIRTEQVPYTETVYEEEVVNEKEPYTVTVMKEVVTYEPYEEEVGEYVPRTIEKQVPRTVKKPVVRETTKTVTRTVMMKVPVDRDGNYLSKPVPLEEGDLMEGRLISPEEADRVPTIDASELNEATGTTLGTPAGENTVYRATPEITNQPGSVLVPKTEPQAAMKPIVNEPDTSNDSDSSSDDDSESTDVPAVTPPNDQPGNESGDDQAADRRA
ncbi:MAG: hypothetical protein AAFN77_05345 [Planctomycetota bacterium]